MGGCWGHSIAFHINFASLIPHSVPSRWNSIQSNSIEVHSVVFYMFPFYSILSYSMPCHAMIFYSVLFYSILFSRWLRVIEVGWKLVGAEVEGELGVDVGLKVC